MRPVFSILHTSARPGEWRKVYDAWMAAALHPDEVEYVLVIDQRWGFSTDSEQYNLPGLVVMENKGRRCYVEGVNIAAAASSGSILIVVADDQYPCDEWDFQLFSVIATAPALPDEAKDWPKSGLQSAYVVAVSTGTTDEISRNIFVMPILSRKRYEDQGSKVFYPEYESMFADNDFAEWAQKDGVVIEARGLFFEHRHWLMKSREMDEADRAQNRPEAYRTGAEILKRRRVTGFKPLTQKTIALCFFGELFRGEMFDAALNLYAHVIHFGFNVARLRSYDTNVYLTREGARRSLAKMDPPPDFVLMLDDDNPLSPDGFDLLLSDLESRPDVDGVAGCTWIHDHNKQRFSPSAGLWAADHLHWEPFSSDFRKENRPRLMETGGLPCILFRWSAFEKAGEDCFLPVLDRRLEHGMTGEDMSFFLAAEKGGAVFLCDPRVWLPHLKYCTVEPMFEGQGAPSPVKVAGMIRAKNEGRWIRRTVESIKELCGGNIFVLEDGSTDNTRSEAEAAGAIVFDSPFVGMPLDERRDKEWLQERIIEACLPDWILGIDGDEELEPEGCRKIRQALESRPKCDCFSLRFLYLWDGVDKARFDGVYGRMGRQSLYRANIGLKFRSYYEGEGENHNHVGLHCSNAPGLGGMSVEPLNVFLLHYGYLHKADRIRKTEWIRSIDPHNEQEDFYRHCIQGDVPEVPADAVLKHAGPLDVRVLPPHLVPKFEVVPGPWCEAAMMHGD